MSYACPRFGFFNQSSTSEGFLVPNTLARFSEGGIEMIEFLGRIVGKALYEGILLEYCFSSAFLQKLVGKYSFLDDLSALDPELYRNLIYIKVCMMNIISFSLPIDCWCICFSKHILQCNLSSLLSNPKYFSTNNCLQRDLNNVVINLNIIDE